MANSEHNDWPHQEAPQIPPHQIHEMIEEALVRTRAAMRVTTQKNPHSEELMIQSYSMVFEESDAAVDNLLFDFTDRGLESMKQELRSRLNELVVTGEKGEPARHNPTWRQLKQRVADAIFHPILSWSAYNERKRISRENREDEIRRRLEKTVHLKLLQGFITMAQSKARSLRAEAVQNQD